MDPCFPPPAPLDTVFTSDTEFTRDTVSSTSLSDLLALFFKPEYANGPVDNINEWKFPLPRVAQKRKQDLALEVDVLLAPINANQSTFWTSLDPRLHAGYATIIDNGLERLASFSKEIEDKKIYYTLSKNAEIDAMQDRVLLSRANVAQRDASAFQAWLKLGNDVPIFDRLAGIGEPEYDAPPAYSEDSQTLTGSEDTDRMLVDMIEAQLSRMDLGGPTRTVAPPCKSEKDTDLRVTVLKGGLSKKSGISKKRGRDSSGDGASPRKRVRFADA